MRLKLNNTGSLSPKASQSGGWNTAEKCHGGSGPGRGRCVRATDFASTLGWAVLLLSSSFCFDAFAQVPPDEAEQGVAVSTVEDAEEAAKPSKAAPLSGDERFGAAELRAEEAERLADEEADRLSAPPSLLGRKEGKTAFGGFAGLGAKGGPLLRRGAVLVGGEAGVIVDHRLSLGMAGYVLANELIIQQRASDGEFEPARLLFGYGGVTARYQFVNKSPIYPAVGVLVGPGVITVVDPLIRVSEGGEDLDNEGPRSANGFLVVEPEVQLHANVTRWMRLGLSGSYRFVHGIKLYELHERDLRGFSFGGHLQFGWF